MDPTLQDVLSRLDRVSGQLEELRDGVRQAVAIAELDPDMALTRARKVLEFIVREVYQRRVGEEPGTRPLENLLQRLVKDGHLPEREAVYANAVRGLGNVGTHVFGKKVTKSDVAQSLTQLTFILEWYFEHERPAGKMGVLPPPGTSAAHSAGVMVSAGDRAESVSKPALRTVGKRAARRVAALAVLVFILAAACVGGWWWWQRQDTLVPNPSAVGPGKGTPVPDVSAVAPHDSDLSGVYECVGGAGASMEYHGQIDISKEGYCYRVKWTVGIQHSSGIAIRDGDTLSVAIHDDDKDEPAGIAVYRVESDGKLVGRWSYFGYDGATVVETLVPKK